MAEPTPAKTLRERLEELRVEMQQDARMSLEAAGAVTEVCVLVKGYTIQIDVMLALLADASTGQEPQEHRCAGCGHRWAGSLKGTELCGDCWRKGQNSILAGRWRAGCPYQNEGCPGRSPNLCSACSSPSEAP